MSEKEDNDIIPCFMRSLSLDIFRDRPFIICAGEKSQYNSWIRQIAENDTRIKDLSRQEIARMFIYPYSAEAIQGLRISGYICYGTFYERKDASNIFDVLYILTNT